MNLDRLIQMVLRIVIARGVGLVMKRAMGWLDRRGRAPTARVGQDAHPADPARPAGKAGTAGTGAAPLQGPDAKRLRQQMRLISRIGRMR